MLLGVSLVFAYNINPSYHRPLKLLYSSARGVTIEGVKPKVDPAHNRLAIPIAETIIEDASHHSSHVTGSCSWLRGGSDNTNHVHSTC